MVPPPDRRERRAGPSGSLTLRGLDLRWGARTYLMAILNATPDSFSGDGLLADGSVALARAVDQAARALVDGADILDVGGESTRPGAEPVGAAAEAERVLPLIEALRARFEAPISIDTYKAEVARQAIAAGADLVNDVWGFRADPDLARVVAEAGVPVILMHNRSTPNSLAVAERLGGHYLGVAYTDLLADVRSELEMSLAQARDAGVDPAKIILDPGIGFGKTPAQNLELLDRCAELRTLGYPLLVGTSRKSFIGLTLDLPPEERLEGTAATVAIAIARGADIVRVHDLRSMARVARMTDAIVRRPGALAG
ncbi:MAG: dihydropteroate synthase [Chloroflexi bacterium]|nr:dihydropteroate synthase [Chloroflexota bacterium]